MKYFVLCLCLTTTTTANAAIDTSFGSEGWAVFQSTGQFVGLAKLSTAQDGFLVVESNGGGYLFQADQYLPSQGSITIRAINPDGSINSAFANAGQLELPSVTRDFLEINQTFDDQFTVVGQTGASKFESSGAFEPGFGSDGHISFDDPVDAAAVDQNGIYTANIVLETDSTFLNVMRYRLDDGSLDTSFGDNGTSTLRHFSNALYGAKDMGLDSQGRIIVIGYTLTNGDTDIVTARFLNNGDPDTSFGPNGNAIALYDDIRNQAHGLTFDGDNPIGYGSKGRGLFRLLNDGRNFEPKTTTDIGECNPASMTPLVNGGFLLFGTDDFSPNVDFCLLAYDTDLNVDRSYSNLGSSGENRARFDDFGNDEGANIGMVLPSGRILLAGSDSSGGKLLMLTGPEPNYSNQTSNQPSPSNTSTPAATTQPTPNGTVVDNAAGGSGSGSLSIWVLSILSLRQLAGFLRRPARRS